MESAVLWPNLIVLLSFNLNKAFSEHHVHLSPCYNIHINLTFIIYFWLAPFFEASIHLSHKRTVNATRTLLDANKTIWCFLKWRGVPRSGEGLQFSIRCQSRLKASFQLLKECLWYLKIRIWVKNHIKPSITTWIGDFLYTLWAELSKQEARNLLMIWAIYKMLLFR